MTRTLKHFDPTKEKHIKLLNFIGRWKFATLKMIKLAFNCENTKNPYLNQILKAMVKDNILNVTKSGLIINHRPELIYYLTPKAKQYLTIPFAYISSIRNSSNIANHSLNCLKIIKSLSLKENEYFTEMELNGKYELKKKELGLWSKPRMCDFAYFDSKTNQFVGVEVELFMKSKALYCSNEFDPIDELDKYWGIGGLAMQKVIKLRRKFGVYNEKTNSFIYVKTRELWLKNVRRDAAKQGLDPNKVFEIKKWKFEIKNPWYDPDRKNDSPWADNNEWDEFEQFEAFSKEHVIQRLKFMGYDPNTIKYGFIIQKRNRDCIFARHYYAISKSFYNRIDWYFPKGREVYFKRYLRSRYYDMVAEESNIPRFFQVKTFEFDTKNPVDMNKLLK